jgi:hypothetical protein
MRTVVNPNYFCLFVYSCLDGVHLASRRPNLGCTCTMSRGLRLNMDISPTNTTAANGALHQLIPYEKFELYMNM